MEPARKARRIHKTRKQTAQETELVLESYPIKWLLVKDLRLENFQREETRIVSSIVREFRQERFKPLDVAPMENGGWSVLDGGNRFRAAKLLEFTKVQCRVHEKMSYRERAARHGQLIRSTVKEDPWSKYICDIEAGELWALSATKSAEQYGFSISKHGDGGSQIKAVGSLHKIWNQSKERDQEQGYDRLFYVLYRAWRRKSPAATQAMMLGIILTFLYRYEDTVDIDHLAQRLRKEDPEHIIVSAKQEKTRPGGGGTIYKAGCRVLRDLYNKNLRNPDKKLPE